jgi:chromate transporter
MIYIELFVTFFVIGMFTIGGGYAMLSLIQNEVVTVHGWIDEVAFTDIVAISQMTPGPIGINCATYVGYTATGSVWGSLLATSAIVIPSLVIMLLICKAYFYINARFQRNIYFTRTMRMLRFAVLGLIAAAAMCLITPVSFIDWRSWLIFTLVSAITILPQFIPARSRVFQTILSVVSHPITLIICAGIAGYLIY